MLTWDETVEDGSVGSSEGTRSEFSSDNSSGVMLELNKLMDNENRRREHILGKWIIAPSRCLFTFRPVRQVGLPLVLSSRTIECSNHVFLDIFGSQHHHRQEMITMTNITGLSDKYLAYSNGGWLLFCGTSTTGFDESLSLHNIVTGAYIDLPDIRGLMRSSLYLFSMATSSSFASSIDYIVNVTRKVNRKNYTSQTTIYVTRPNTGSWEVYTITHKPSFLVGIPKKINKLNVHVYNMVAAIIFGKKVYVFDHSERVVVFDLVERRWWSITGLERQKSEFHVAESDGKIVKVSPKDGLNQYRFSSLEWDDEEYRASWVEMSECELENKSWFLGHLRSRTCCIKDCRENGGQAAVYRFTHERVSPTAGFALNIQVHDLKAGTTSSVGHFPGFSTATSGWVDLGYSSERRV